MINLSPELINLVKSYENSKLRAILKNENISNIVDSDGTTLLHYSVRYNNQSMTKFCVNSKCDIDAKDVHGITPLFMAAEHNSFESMGILLNAGADIFYTTPDGRSTLCMIFGCQQEIPPCILRNVLRKITSSCTSSNIIADVLIKARFPFYQVIYANNSEVTKIMLKHGSPVNDRNPHSGKTALQEAVILHDVKNVRVLLDYNAQIDINSKVLIETFYKNIKGYTMNDLKVAFLLIEQLTQSNSLNEYGYFFLGPIFKMATREVLEAFLQYNIDLNEKDINGKTLMHHVALNNKQRTIDLFRNKRVNINAKDNSGYTALQYAAGYAMSSGVYIASNIQFLLEKGAEIGRTNEEVYLLLQSFLIFTFTEKSFVAFKSKRCMELLLQFGADPQIVNKDGKSIIDFALPCAYTYKIKLVLESIIAHIAFLLALDKPVIDSILEKINGHPQLKRNLMACEKEIEKMKKCEISKGITIFQILSKSEKNIRKYVRQEKNILRFMNSKGMPKVNSYYSSLLNRRINKAIEMNKLTEVAAKNIMESILLFKGQHVIVNQIVSFLSFADLLMFS